MSDLKYGIGADSSQAVAAFKALQNQVQATTSVFSKMKEAVAGLATAAFVQNLLSMADSLSDAATAAGVSTEALMGFSRAIAANGGDMDKAINGMAKFSETLGGAKEGSKQAQDTMYKLGISLKDLGSLSEEDLLKKTVEGIAAIEDPSKRAAAGVDAFGKAAKGVDWKGVAADIDKYTESSREAAAAIESAGQVNDMLAGAYKDFQVQLLLTLKPLAELAKAIMAQKEAIGFLLKVLSDLAVAFAVFKYVLPGIRTVIRSVNELADAMATGGLAASSLGRFVTKEMNNMLTEFSNLKSAVTGVSIGFAAVGTAGARLATGFAAVLSIGLRFASWIGIFLAIYDVVNALVRLITGSGLGEWADKVGKKIAGIFGIEYRTEAEKAKKTQEDNKKAAEEVVDAYKQQRDAIKEIVEQFEKQNQKTSDQLNLETELIGTSKEYQDARKAQFAIEQQYKETLDKLTEARDKLTAAELRAGLGANYDESIKKLKEARQAALEKMQVDVQNNIIATNADELRKFGQQNELANFKELQSFRDKALKSTMSELEIKKFDLEIAARSRFQEKVASEEQRLGRKLSAAEREAFKQKALEGLKELQDEAEKEYKNSKKFETGWSQAFSAYADAATNAAEKARKIFESVSTGLEDALFRFFTTGKLGWKEFANDVIKEMIRIETKQLAMNILTGGRGTVARNANGSLGGLLGLGGLFGFLAEGGPAAMNKPYIVGERGPELFVPSSNGQMVPNSGLGGSTNVTYNINAVDAMSFKQMVARDPSFIYAVSQQGARTLPGVA